jgi:hypothetical protein
MSFLNSVISNAKSQILPVNSALSRVGQDLARGDLNGAISNLANFATDSVSNIGSNGGTSPGNYHAGIQARGDALQNWCWYCLLPNISNNNAVSLSGGVFESILGASSVKPSVSLPWYYVQSANLPQRNIATDSVSVNGHQSHFPESYSVPNLTLGFFLDNTNKVQEWLKAWQGQILVNADPTIPGNQGGWGLPANYKKTINIVVLDVKQSRMLDVRYINCWPTDPQALELGSGTAEGLVQSVSFQVEDVEISVYNDKGLVDTLVDTAKGYAIGALSGLASQSLNSVVNNFFATPPTP